MYQIQNIVNAFRNLALTPHQEILKKFVNNSIQEKDIRFEAGKCHVYDLILTTCAQVEKQLQESQPPTAATFNNPAASNVQTTSIPLSEGN